MSKRGELGIKCTSYNPENTVNPKKKRRKKKGHFMESLFSFVAKSSPDKIHTDFTASLQPKTTHVIKAIKSMALILTTDVKKLEAGLTSSGLFS